MKKFCVFLFMCIACGSPKTKEPSTASGTPGVLTDTLSMDTTADADGFRDVYEVISAHVTSHFLGLINEKYQVQMTLASDDSGVHGHYQYFNQKDLLSVKGTIDSASGVFHLEESVYEKEGDKPQITGYFEGLKKGSLIKGTWTDVKQTKSFPFTLVSLDKEKKFRFKVRYKVKSDMQYIKDITVLDSVGNRVEGISDVNGPQLDQKPELYLEDMNIDGYRDLMIVDSMGMTDSYYRFYIFRPGPRVFIGDAENFSIGNPEVDLKNRQIRSVTRSSAAEQTTRIYVHTKNRFHLIEQQDDVNGKIKVTKFEIPTNKSAPAKN